jgi:hypothetical protein
MSGRWYQDQLYLVLDRAKRRNTLSGMVYDRQSSEVFNRGPACLSMDGLAHFGI